MSRQENEKLTQIVYAGVFAALTALLTAALHIPVGNGYVHCGDAVIYLAAVILPLPYAIAASAIGGMLADVLSGYVIYAVPTFIVKALVALTFALVSGKKLLSKRTIPAMIAAGVVSVIGYWITAVILYGGWSAQFVGTVPGNIVQAVGSGAVYIVAALALHKLHTHQPRLGG